MQGRTGQTTGRHARFVDRISSPWGDGGGRSLFSFQNKHLLYRHGSDHVPGFRQLSGFGFELLPRVQEHTLAALLHQDGHGLLGGFFSVENHVAGLFGAHQPALDAEGLHRLVKSRSGVLVLEKGLIWPSSRRKTLLSTLWSPLFSSGVSMVSFLFLSTKESWFFRTSAFSLRFITKYSLNFPEFLSISKAWLASPSRPRPRTS